MIILINQDKVPFRDILFQAIDSNSINHDTTHKGTLVFSYLIHRLCVRAQVPFISSNQCQPTLALYGKTSVVLSEKVSSNFLSFVAFTSESAALRYQLEEKEKIIQHLLSLIPSSSHLAPGLMNLSTAADDVEPNTEDSTSSKDSLDSLGFLDVIGNVLARG